MPSRAAEPGKATITGLAIAAWRRFQEERCMQVAGSLTYTTLLALVPLITVALAVATTFPVFREWTSNLDSWLGNNVLPPQIAGAITRYVGEFTAAAAGLTAIGIGILALTAVLLMLTIDRGLSQIFRITRPRPLTQRLLMYWAVLSLGPVLMGASISMTSMLVSASLGAAKELPFLRFLLLRLTPFVLTTAAITLVYLAVPNRKVLFRHALVGGMVAGIAFEAMQRGFAIYIQQFPTYTVVYGAFAVVPIFLVWMYLSWTVVLFGAAVTAVLPGYHGEERRGRPAGRQFYEALELLGAMAQAQRAGRTLTLSDLVQGMHISPDQVERMLERMEGAKWIARGSGDRWVLTRPADQLLVADVYRAFIMDAGSLRSDAGTEVRALHELLATPRAGLEATLQMPLADLYGEPPSAEEPLRGNRVLEIIRRSNRQP